MIWTLSETLALARQSCACCIGLGLRPGRNGNSVPCNCVFRAIFRGCFARFRECIDDVPLMTAKPGFVGAPHAVDQGRRSARSAPHQKPRRAWSLKRQEYCADFVLVSRRALTGDELASRLFRYHFLLGAPWDACCRAFARHGLEIARGEFFHEVYRVEQRLGRVYAELQPYPLWPLDGYFSASQEKPLSELAFALPAIEPDDLPKHAPVRNKLIKLRFPLKGQAGS